MKIVFLVIFILFSLLLIAQVPDWQWAYRAGGNDDDKGRDIASDEYGNLYITGEFEGTAYFDSFSITSSGGRDIYVAKYNNNGICQWVSQAGGYNMENVESIIVDYEGNCFVTGNFHNSIGFGSFTLTSFGFDDIFIAKIDSNGNWLWATQAGGTGSDNGHGIAVNNDGNCVVTGSFDDSATFGTYTISCNGMENTFVAKIDSNGNWLWASHSEENSVDYGASVKFDDNGNIYIVGSFEGTTIFGSNTIISDGHYDIFVAKIDENGNWLWASQAGGYDIDYGVDIDIEGINCYITGGFSETAEFGPYQINSSGIYDIFVAKLDTDGNWLWASRAGSDSYDWGTGISTDGINCYVIGSFMGMADFGSNSITSFGMADIYVAKVDSNGYWQWVINAGDNDYETGSKIALNNNDCYITGYFLETASFGSHFLYSSGDYDVCIAKLGNVSSVVNEIELIDFQFFNHPNPFNPSTTIEFLIQNDSEVELSIYNIKGQMINTLANDEYTKGNHSIIWNGDDVSGKRVSSGVYLYKLNVNGKIKSVRKCLLLK